MLTIINIAPMLAFVNIRTVWTIANMPFGRLRGADLGAPFEFGPGDGVVVLAVRGAKGSDVLDDALDRAADSGQCADASVRAQQSYHANRCRMH